MPIITYAGKNKGVLEDRIFYPERNIYPPCRSISTRFSR